MQMAGTNGGSLSGAVGMTGGGGVNKRLISNVVSFFLPSDCPNWNNGRFQQQ
jgi:hypothetical protein